MFLEHGSGKRAQIWLTSPLIFAVLNVLSTVKEFTETAVPFF